MDDIGKRIIVIGSPGSGKSTFSRKLAEITEIPLIHLDKEFWNNGWIETPKGEWIKKQENIISGSDWIIDGNYGGTLDIRIEKADIIICFQLSRVVCIMRYFKRIITNMGKVRPDMPEGCPEHFDFEFLKYIWNFSKTSGQRNIKKLQESKGKKILIFRKKNDANKYISMLEMK
jgi:adenylate kinase family enzyme